MSVRNFAEAIGKFVPSDDVVKSEKNTISSKYSRLFSVIRALSRTVQYAATFLERLLEKDDDEFEEFKQRSATLKLTRLFSSIRSSFSKIRGIVAQLLNTYNYYFPEIAYTRCVGKFVRREYPNLITFENMFNLLTEAYQYAKNYIRELSTDNHSMIGTKVADMSYSDFNDYYQNQNYQVPQHQQELYALYNPNTAAHNFYNGLETRKSRRALNSDSGILYVGPRLLDEPVQSNNVPNADSIFNFDDILEKRFGMKEHLESNCEDEEDETFKSCTQTYALELLWRIAEDYLSQE